jgi:hypothetical protein
VFLHLSGYGLDFEIHRSVFSRLWQPGASIGGIDFECQFSASSQLRAPAASISKLNFVHLKVLGTSGVDFEVIVFSALPLYCCASGTYFENTSLFAMGTSRVDFEIHRSALSRLWAAAASIFN